MKFREEDRNLQTYPRICGGNQKLNYTEQSTQKHTELVVDLGSREEDDHEKISRRAGNPRLVVDARLWQRNRSKDRQAEAGIFLVAARSSLLSRSDLKTRIEARE